MTLLRSTIMAALLLAGPALGQGRDPETGQPAPLAPLDLDAFAAGLADYEIGDFPDPDGGLRSFVGVFDVGLSRRQIDAGPAEALALGLRRYFDENRERFGHAPGFLELLHLDPPETARNDELWLVKAHAVWRGARVSRTAFSCVFARSGPLLGCSGNLPGAGIDPARLPASSLTRPETAVRTALAVAGLAYDEELGPYTAVPDPGREVWIAQSGEGLVTAERLVDGATHAYLWKIETEADRILWDQRARAIVSRTPLSDDIHDLLPIQHRSPTAAAFDASNPANRNALSERVGSYGPVLINYLQYGVVTGYDWALARVTDNNSANVVSFTSPPNFPGGFPSNIGSALRQQTVFYWAWTARQHFRWDAWGTHAPNKKNTLDLYVDEPDKCNNSACFKDWGAVNDPGLYFDVSEGGALDPYTIVHEFGHYIVWTYGDVDNGCDKGKDESDAIDESVADVVTQLVFHRYFRNSGLQNPYRGNNGWTAGTAAYPRTFKSSNCKQPVWNYGTPFEEAMWEALHGVDCEGRGPTGCALLSGSGSASPFGDFGWINRFDANQSLTRALAFSLDATGDEPAFKDLKFWMMFELALNAQMGPASLLVKVAAYHGF